MNPILVALDVGSASEARSLADTLRGAVGGFKIGIQLFTSAGPAIVEELVGRGDRVFLDLKFHDIPNTVAGAVTAATRLGVWMLNVHASGGHEMMRAAALAAAEEAVRLSRPAPIVVAVTVLTSLSDGSVSEIGVNSTAAAQVERLAALAQKAGLGGVVASPKEIAVIRATCGPSFVIVTPGIRAGSDNKGDQQRTGTAAEALAAGASYLVVGRPITEAPNPRDAAERIAADCRGSRVA
jgi:orotidine-5'-phosphate decarboxylase